MHPTIHFNHQNVRYIKFKLNKYHHLKVSTQYMGHEVSISLSELETQQLVEFIKNHLSESPAT